MTLLERSTALGLVLLCGTTFGLAGGCGSSDDKKAQTGAAEAGAAGAEPTGSGGSSSDGGKSGSSGGPNQASAGKGGNATGGVDNGSGGEATAEGGTGVIMHGGVSGQGGASDVDAGGAPPLAECNTEGSATNLDATSDAIYRICPGALVRVPFDVYDATDSFSCCGVAGAKPAFGVTLLGEYNHDGGGNLEFVVPANAPYGSYALELTCPTDPATQSLSLEVGNTAAPLVESVDGEITPDSDMRVNGLNLGTVTRVAAIRASDHRSYECVFDPKTQQTATSITCNFGNKIPKSVGNDFFYIDVFTDGCGFAPNPPTFKVMLPT